MIHLSQWAQGLLEGAGAIFLLIFIIFVYICHGIYTNKWRDL